MDTRDVIMMATISISIIIFNLVMPLDIVKIMSMSSWFSVIQYFLCIHNS